MRTTLSRERAQRLSTLYCCLVRVGVALDPVLLYESSAGCHWHEFRHILGSHLYLAGVGILFTTFVLAAAVKEMLPSVIGLHFTWPEAFLLGSTLASTDPVAVVSVLKSLGCPAKLLIIFEGESLLNDGTSVVLFSVGATANLPCRSFWNLLEDTN